MARMAARSAARFPCGRRVSASARQLCTRERAGSSVKLGPMISAISIPAVTAPRRRGIKVKWRWLLAALSAVLLDLPFPIAGPLPLWRSVFAWVALVPLIYAVLSGASWFGVASSVDQAKEKKAGTPSVARSFLLGYLCGVIWYVLN